jgi:hypothetical protein
METNVTEDGERLRRMARLTGGLAGAAALGAWWASGGPDAAGAAAGGLIALANLLWLEWVVRRAVRGLEGGGGVAVRAPGVVAAACARYAVVAAVLGLVTARGAIGVGWLLVGLTALPVAAVVEGLRAKDTEANRGGTAGFAPVAGAEAGGEARRHGG